MSGFTFPRVRASGVSRRALDRLVMTGDVVQFSHGAYTLRKEFPTLRARAQALSELLPADVVVGRRTAAWLWGLDVLPPGATQAAWPVELLRPPGATPPRRPWTRGFTTDLPAYDVTEVCGVRVTTPERTALDCARWLPRLEAVAAFDQFLRREVDAGQIQVRALALAGRRFARHLREVIELGDVNAESPGESWTRVLVCDAGFPRPTTQIPEVGRQGQKLYIDLGEETCKVGIEYDGEEHHTSPSDVAHDQARRAWLAERGWHIIPVTKYDVLCEPRPFLAEYLDALLARGWSPSDDSVSQILTAIEARRPQPRAA